MKKRPFYWGLLWMVLLAAWQCRRPATKTEDDRLENLQALTQQIRQALAPDARDHVFEAHWSLDSMGRYQVRLVSDVPQVRQALTDSLARVPLAVDVEWTLLPEPPFDTLHGVVDVSVAQLRTRPDHRAELASQVLMGMPVELAQQRGGFYRVRTPEGYWGWMDTASVAVMNDRQWARWLAAPKVIMMENYGQIYDTLSPEAAQVSDWVRNDVVRLLGEEAGAYRVQLPGGREGYLPESQAVTLEEWENLNRRFAGPRDVVDDALRHYQGIPYLWGGTSVKALDCSGFIKNLYQSYGILLPRDASQQARVVHPVPLDERLDSLEPGDLLFFGRRDAEGNAHVTHVALYIGRGRVIHATGRVKVESLLPGDSLYNDRRRKSLLSAGRIFGYYDKRIYPYYTTRGGQAK